MCVGFGTEAEVQLPGLFQYRTPDQGRVGKQQLRRGRCRDPIPDFRIQWSPGGAATIDQLFPAQCVQPVREARGLQAVAAEIVEAMGDALGVEPAPRLFDGIAIADAVDIDHARTHREKRRPE